MTQLTNLRVSKDSTELAIEAIEDALGVTNLKDNTGETLGDILDIAKDRLALPTSVQKFNENFRRNFSRTADALRHRAGILRQTAAFLDDRAKRLDDAVPHLTKEIEDWITFERECAAREQSLSLIKPE